MFVHFPRLLRLIQTHPDLPLREIPSLWRATITKGSPDLVKARYVLDGAHSNYLDFQHLPCLAKCYWVLLELLKADWPPARFNNHTERLLMLAYDALLLFAKAASWYGHRGKLSSLNALRDAELLCRVLGDDDKRAEALMRMSSEFYKQERYAIAQTCLDLAEQGVKSTRVKSDILGVGGSICVRSQNFREALRRQSVGTQLDEKYGATLESAGIHLLGLGISELNLGYRDGRHKVENGVSLCQKAANPGFLFQAYGALCDYHMERGERDEARGYLEMALNLSGIHYHSYTTQLRRLKEIVNSDFPELRSELPRRPSANDESLDQVFTMVDQSLESNELFSAVVGLNFCVERMIKMVGLNSGLEGMNFNKMALSKRNALLAKRGVYGVDVFSKIDALRSELRNTVSHADLESSEVRKYLTPHDLKQLRMWCSWFATEFL